jgi:hypothetical protein
MGAGPSARVAPGPWPLPIRIGFNGVAPGDKADIAASALRARPGVAVISGDAAGGAAGGVERGATISVSACGDLRAFVSGRLRGEGPRADLSEVATRVEACECGSGFEADLACDAVARVRTPEAAALAAAHRAVCLVHLDPEGAAPACRVLNDHGALDGLDPATLVGPFAARAHAESWAAMLDTRFELCRKPSVLARQPGAEACHYKDMGLCPAPCDGSEPMDRYRARAREALAFDGAAFAAERARLTDAVGALASAMDFEQAGALQQRLGTLDAARSPGIGWVTTMDRFRVLAAMPAGRKGWARVFLHDASGTDVLADVDATRDGFEDAVIRMVGEARSRASAGCPFDGAAADRAALIAQHARSGRRTRGRVLMLGAEASGTGAGSLDQGINRADLIRAVRRAADATPVLPGSTPPDEGDGSTR